MVPFSIHTMSDKWSSKSIVERLVAAGNIGQTEATGGQLKVCSSFLPIGCSSYDRHPYSCLRVTSHSHGTFVKHHCRRRPGLSSPSLRDSCCPLLFFFFSILFALCGAGVLMWPSNPDVKIVDIELSHVNFSKHGERGLGRHPSPVVMVDLKIQVRNRDFVDRAYDSILLLLQYEGKWEGNATTEGVSVAKRSTSFLQLNAGIDLNRLVNLPGDGGDGGGGGAIKGFMSVGIAIHVGGNFPFLYFDVVVHGSTSCVITVDAEQKALTCQECCSGIKKNVTLGEGKE